MVKINAVAFLLEKEAEKKLQNLPSILTRIFNHSLSEIPPYEKMTNEELCKAVKNRIMHHLGTTVENYKALVLGVVVFQGLEVFEELKEVGETRIFSERLGRVVSKLESILERVPPTAGVRNFIAYDFPYIEAYYDPLSTHWLFRDLPPWVKWRG